VESLQISRQINNLNLLSNDSLHFLVENKTLKSVDFSNFQFSIDQMEILCQSLSKNESLTSLDFSKSNFHKFEFLNSRMKILKFLTFKEINNQSFLDFVEYFTGNQTLTSLNISFSFDFKEADQEVEQMIDIVRKHKKLEFFEWKTNIRSNSNEFFKLLQNQCLKTLKLNLNLMKTKDDGISEFFTELNNNKTLTELDFNFMVLDFNSNFEIKNQSIEKLTICGKYLTLFIFEGKSVKISNNVSYERKFNFPSLKSLSISGDTTSLIQFKGELDSFLSLHGTNNLEHLSIHGNLNSI
jgi:hypothetical protein